MLVPVDDGVGVLLRADGDGAVADAVAEVDVPAQAGSIITAAVELGASLVKHVVAAEGLVGGVSTCFPLLMACSS